MDGIPFQAQLRISNESREGEAAQSSFPNIYRVLRLVGSASLATTALSLLRNKAFAIFLGPEGYGSIVLLNSLLSTAGNIGGVGTGYSGTRLISRARGRGQGRSAEMLEACMVFLGHKQQVAIFFGTCAVLFAWQRSTGHFEFEASWILAVAAGAALSNLASINNTRLQVRRLPGRIAIASIVAAVLHSFASIVAAWRFGAVAIPVAVVAVPASMALASWLALRDQGLDEAARTGERGRRVVEASLLSVGAGLMLPGIVDAGGGFAVRAAGAACMGLAAVGQVFAASALVGFITVTVMTAMNQDFLPRLCEAVDDRGRLRRLAGEQLVVSMHITGPVVLLLCTFSHEVTRLLFSSEFGEAAAVLPVMSILVMATIYNWPLHMLQTALNRPRHQLAGSVANSAVALLVIGYWGSDLDHLRFAGALVAGWVAQAIVQGTLLWRSEGLLYGAREWLPALSLMAALVAMTVAGRQSSLASKAIGLGVAAAWSAIAVRHYARHAR